MNYGSKDETPYSEVQIRWLLDVAERGFLDEQYELAMYYLEGNGLEKDYARAVEWFRKAAEQEHPRAQYELGRCYENGIGVKKDRKMAAEWFRKAAGQDNTEAQLELAKCYENGEGVKKNKTEAVKWYRKAAEQGNAEAQFELTKCYENGEGVRDDKTEAVNWYHKAAERRSAAAKNELQYIDDDDDDRKLDLGDLNPGGNGDADKKAGEPGFSELHLSEIEDAPPAEVDNDDAKQLLLNVLFSFLIFFVPAVLVCGLITKFSDTSWNACWAGMGTIYCIIVLSIVFSSFSLSFRSLFYDYEFTGRSGLFTIAAAAFLIVTSIVKGISGISWDDAMTGGFVVYLTVYISSIVWVYQTKDDKTVDLGFSLIYSSIIAAFWLVVWALAPNISWEASLLGAFAVYLISIITSCLIIAVSRSEPEDIFGMEIEEMVENPLFAPSFCIAFLLIVCSIVKWIFGFGWGGCLFFGFIAYVAFYFYFLKKGGFD